MTAWKGTDNFRNFTNNYFAYFLRHTNYLVQNHFVFVINGMLLSPVGLHPPVSSLQEGGPVWCAPVGQWLLPAASHQTGQFIRSPGTKLHLLLTACTEHWLTARLASVWSPSLEQSGATSKRSWLPQLEEVCVELLCFCSIEIWVYREKCLEREWEKWSMNI